METNLKFLRATHDRVTGKYKEDIFGYEAIQKNFIMKRVWEKYGNYVHLLSCNNPVTFEELLDEIRRDVVNYPYRPDDICTWSDNIGTLPSFGEVALALVRLIETGFVEVVKE
jgi:hypothetical protein